MRWLTAFIYPCNKYITLQEQTQQEESREEAEAAPRCVPDQERGGSP
jgi:hypothetical protein